MKHPEHERNTVPREIVTDCETNLTNETCSVTVIHPENAASPAENTVYHAANTYLGETYTFDNGGHYELIVDNSLIYHDDTKEFPETNNTPQLSGSYSPAACIIARIHEWNNTSGAIGQNAFQVTLYEFNRDPDVDLRSCPDRDFALLEEVRYNNPSENPIEGNHYMTVVLPERVSLHVRQLYHPNEDVPGTYTPRTDEWCAEQYGYAVKQAINTYLKTGDYPDPKTFIKSVETR